MINLVVYIAFFILGGIPIALLLKPNATVANNDDKKIIVKQSPITNAFVLTSILQFVLGYAATIFARTFFYYESDSLFIGSLLVLIISHCWPIFNGFKKNSSPLLLITGVCCVFYTQFLWLIPLLFIVFSFLLNSQYISYFACILSLLFVYLFIDNIPDSFLFLNLGIFIILVTLFYNHIFAAIEGKTITFIKQFNKRTN